MVSNSENKAQKLLRKMFGKFAFIRKIPDYKATGMVLGGLPDYLVISNGNHFWFEIKQLSKDKKSLPYNTFTDQQFMTFRQMMDNGAIIRIVLYNGKNIYIKECGDIFNYIITNDKKKSIPIEELKRWDIYGEG